MIINLNENWRLKSDPLQWILEHRGKEGKKKGIRTGKPAVTWKPVSYHQDVWAALFDACNRHVRQIQGEFPAQSQEVLLTAMNEMQTMCENGQKEFNKLRS